MASWQTPEASDRHYAYGGCPAQRPVEDRQYPDLLTLYFLEERENRHFASGARRDSDAGKPRYDLISPLFLERFAQHLRRGAEHYGENNWHRGIPSKSYMASLMRHVEAYRAGDRSEDHLSAIAFNAMGLMHNENTELDDLYEW